MPLARALAAVTSRPAAIMQVDAGAISEGAAADLCVFDPDAHVRITPESLRSQGKNTPFIGYELPGACATRWYAGQVVYESVR